MEPTQETKTPPTKEQMINFYKEQLEVKEVQLQVQELNTKIATSRANELEALAKVDHFTKQVAGDIVQHVLTQKDVDRYPQISEQNLKVGDTISIPKDAYQAFLDGPETKPEINTGTQDAAKPGMTVV